MSDKQGQKSPRVSAEVLPVGVDDGHAEIKLALPDGRLIKIPSKARAGVYGLSVFSGRLASGAEGVGADGGYETENQRFTVSDHVDGEGTRFDEYPFSAINRVLIHHGLRLAGLGGRPVKLATGLPVSHFFQDSNPNYEAIERKEASIKTPVRTLSGDACADIQASHVIAEGVAAWVDYSVTSAGEVNNDQGRVAAVVDIGGRTTDCVTVLPGWSVDHARSGTGNIGVLDLHEAVRARLCKKFGLNEMPASMVEEAVRTGRVVVWGKPNDVADVVDEVKKLVGNQILREVQRRIGRGADLSKVLFVGGGAEVFKDLPLAFPNAAAIEHPQFSNARGMLKFLMYVM